MTKRENSRRGFIKNSLGAFAAFTIIPRHVLGSKGFVPASDQLTKAIIDVGDMGRGHFGYGNTRIVAICDVDSKHLQEAYSMIGEKGVKTFSDHREVIRLPEVDIVHIATPPHWHGIIAAETGPGRQRHLM